MNCEPEEMLAALLLFAILTLGVFFMLLRWLLSMTL